MSSRVSRTPLNRRFGVVTIVQAMTPGRYYDLRDVAANTAGAVLGTLVIAVWRAGSGER